MYPLAPAIAVSVLLIAGGSICSYPDLLDK